MNAGYKSSGADDRNRAVPAVTNPYLPADKPYKPKARNPRDGTDWEALDKHKKKALIELKESIENMNKMSREKFEHIESH